jgi:carotenoid cleavage dioxygenase-like enzyme
LETYGSESNYFETEGRLLSDKEEVEKIIWDYLEELGPEVKAVARINFSQKNVASTSVTYDNWTNKIRINV